MKSSNISKPRAQPVQATDIRSAMMIGDTQDEEMKCQPSSDCIVEDRPATAVELDQIDSQLCNSQPLARERLEGGGPKPRESKSEGATASVPDNYSDEDGDGMSYDFEDEEDDAIMDGLAGPTTFANAYQQ